MTVFFFLFKLKFLFSFATCIAVYWSLWGAECGIGFAVLILVHEMGHFIDIKRRGLPVDMRVFLPGLGAYVRWQAMGVPLETRSAVSVAGPLAGWLGSAVCGLVWWQTGNPLWAALARSSAWLNALNLIPLWILDGGSAILALSKVERAVVLVVAVGLAFALDEKIFYLVAAGAAWPLFTKDEPDHPRPGTTAYHRIILTLLAFPLWARPWPRVVAKQKSFGTALRG